ncbi:hypothetical protein [Chitinibacter sp. S2-10]|uniref:hypothetical protein n=1 Tax=Chitinibacter sp. S2-10 TaxID=3373597 RepID=UPI00397768B9
MNLVRPLIIATTFAFLSTAALAEDAHHPASAASSAKAKPAHTASPMVSKESMQKMDQQIKAMQDMHAKMLNAKTPEARNALMTEQMKVMQDGMAMMSSMPMMSGMMDGKMGMMGGKNGMAMDVAASHQMMEKRMKMMESMMQMMMDRMPAAK